MTNLAVDYKNYLEKVDDGFTIMKGKTAILCALARNNEEKLEGFFAKVEELSKHFKRLDVIVIENDSTDNTAILLKNWKAANDKSLEPHIGCTWLVSETLKKSIFGAEDSIARASHMAACRNKYLEIVKGYRSDTHYTIVVDSDLFSWEIQGIANSFGWQQELQWSAMFSNGLDVFRDKLIYYDIWSHSAFGEVDNKVALPLPAYHRPVNVLSGFGGLAIYRTSAIISGKYEGLAVGSEHYGLHRSMEAAGWREFYINPSQTTLRLDEETLKQNSKGVLRELGV